MENGAFIPVGDLMRQLVLAFGAALLVGNLAVVVRERVRRRRGDDEGPKANLKLVTLNMVLGGVLVFWGVASIMAAR